MNNKAFSVNELSNAYKIELLQYIKVLYMNEVKYIGAEQEPNTFAWINNSLTIWIVQIYNKAVKSVPHILIFATKNKVNTDQLKIKDLTKETQPFNVQNHFQSGNADLALKLLISKKLININKDKVINQSLAIKGITKNDFNDLKNTFCIKQFAKKFADNEYNNTNKELDTPVINNIDFNKQLFFANKYDFQTIINTIDDKQFELELEECLWAYNQEKWFICAAGLGSVIEHLMLFTILNYHNKNMLSKLGKTPTAFNYINAFQMKPINIDPRQEMYIRTLFQVRNCVSHYSTGYTDKGLVDTLLSGIRNIFQQYYLNSVKYKEEQ